MTAIPLVDLGAQYRSIKDEVDAAIARVIESSGFIGGTEVATFERAFASYCDVEHCVGVGNGTDALWLSLHALGLEPGAEVIVPVNTFIATAEAVTLAGGVPVFVDVLDDTMQIDPASVTAAITPRTAGILPVHLYGHPCEIDEVVAIAERHGLFVVEDAAQAHGARWRGRRVGSFAQLATFSFYPGKNLGAYGDAGAVVSTSPDLAASVRQRANHGRREKYLHDEEGTNSRLDALQAAVLSVKLAHLDQWNGCRRWAAGAYDDRLRQLPVTTPSTAPDAEPVHHLYVVRTDHRDEVRRELGERGVSTGVHYPVPLHLQPAYAHLGLRPGAFPIAEQHADTMISLPMYPELGEAEIDAVVAALAASIDAAARARS